MKKIIASALGLMLGGTLLATSAQAEFESQFGGYWRTRFMFEDNMRSYPDESKFHVDTRTRLYYTAKFNDNLKFVNKFEFDADWGDDGYGDLGTDGKVFEIKHSYIDAKFNAIQLKVGAQGYVINRGITYDDDAVGVFVRGNFGAVAATALWTRFEDESFGGAYYDRDMLHAGVKINVGDAVSIVPSVTALISDEGSEEVEADDGTTSMVANGDEELIYVGIDVDAKLDPVSIWGTFIYETGDVLGVDKEAFAVAMGADASFVRGSFYYATGDDGSDPTENTRFTAISAWHTTAEILGRGGVLSAGSGQSAGTFGFAIEDVILGGVGTTIKPMDKMALKLDGWYGALAEDNAAGNADLGFEFDAVLTVTLLEKLRADFVFAYLIAGDATNDANGNDDDCIEAGMRLSLSF